MPNTLPTQNERRVALITGASRGIGAACARAFAQEGYNVVINHSNEYSKQKAMDLAESLSAEYGMCAMAIQADVSSFEQAKHLIEETKERFGRIDVLVNNAGITRDGLLVRMSEDDFSAVVDTNLRGAFNCMRHASQIMMKQHYGRIVNISSVVGISGNPGQTNYAASKAGIIGLTKAAAKELAKRNITVNAVAPGFIQTDMTKVLPEKARQAIAERIACGSLGAPEDVAYAVISLARPEARYITGQVLAVDGGIA